MRYGDYEIVEGIDRADLAKVHAMLTESYWCKGISRKMVEKAARNSTLVLSAYHGKELVGYLRVVSDLTTFGWISDVIVDPAHMGKGIARAMVRYALEHPEHQRFRRWVLKTKDAQDVYTACGFKLVDDRGHWMDYRPPDAPPTNE